MGTQLMAAEVALSTIGFDVVERLIGSTVGQMMNLQTATISALDRINQANETRAENERRVAAETVAAAQRAAQERARAPETVEQREGRLSSFLNRAAAEQTALHAQGARTRMKWTDEERFKIERMFAEQKKWRPDPNQVTGGGKPMIGPGISGAEKGAAKMKGGMIAGQLLVGLQDGMQVYQGGGGAGRALMASFNNIIQAASLAGPYGQIAATIGVIGVQMYQMWDTAKQGSEEAKKELDDYITTLANATSRALTGTVKGKGLDFLRSNEDDQKGLTLLSSQTKAVEGLYNNQYAHVLDLQKRFGLTSQQHGKEYAQKQLNDETAKLEAIRKVHEDHAKKYWDLDAQLKANKTVIPVASKDAVDESMRKQELENTNAAADAASRRTVQGRQAAFDLIRTEEELSEAIEDTKDRIKEQEKSWEATWRAAVQSGDMRNVDQAEKDMKRSLEMELQTIEAAEARKLAIRQKAQAEYDARRARTAPENTTFAMEDMAAKAAQKGTSEDIQKIYNAERLVDLRERAVKQLYDEAAAGNLTKQRQQELLAIIEGADARKTQLAEEEFSREVAREKAMNQIKSFSFASLSSQINTLNHDDERKRQHDRTNVELKRAADSLDSLNKKIDPNRPVVAVAG